jgi:hypothetical protein
MAMSCPGWAYLRKRGKKAGKIQRYKRILRRCFEEMGGKSAAGVRCPGRKHKRGRNLPDDAE